jgi:alpha-galactosidase
MLNLYRMLESITSAFPDVLFESCSGGGGRFDPGMLYYMPQTWTSDDTDAVARLKIQYGTSLVYPAVTMGCHVSAVPNHQVQRTTPLEMRGHVASSGNFGYEMDLNRLTGEEQETILQQIAFYKEIRPLVQFGELYRLLDPGAGNETAWMYVSNDRSEAVAFYFRVLAEPNPVFTRIRLKGLDGQAEYQVSETGQVFGGDFLMFAGLTIPKAKLAGDFQSVCWRLKKPCCIQ